MENAVELLSKDSLIQFETGYNLCGHERDTLSEIAEALKKKDAERLKWFLIFGKDIRRILLNVYAYRKGFEFGFTEIEFDEYGWFKRPVFLSPEELKFGIVEKDRYGNYSTITLGHGPNGIWTYGISMSYGTAGSCSGISVYHRHYQNRQDALDAALLELKLSMQQHVGDSDTTNYNQKVILATLKSIEALKVSRVQLSLF